MFLSDSSIRSPIFYLARKISNKNEIRKRNRGRWSAENSEDRKKLNQHEIKKYIFNSTNFPKVSINIFFFEQ